ncbi:hypothetical protein TorRG33x02_169110 [Trema orientale]|uniref:Secreted protein n=1 Tax=Trema orientale TaxID=63057 RepID=A0A2P5EP78_TREOI|nr:hypothetical protein TorRG33x02_169110 [Trema orientale]
MRTTSFWVALFPVAVGRGLTMASRINKGYPEKVSISVESFPVKLLSSRLRTVMEVAEQKEEASKVCKAPLPYDVVFGCTIVSKLQLLV